MDRSIEMLARNRGQMHQANPVITLNMMRCVLWPDIGHHIVASFRQSRAQLVHMGLDPAERSGQSLETYIGYSHRISPTHRRPIDLVLHRSCLVVLASSSCRSVYTAIGRESF